MSSLENATAIVGIVIPMLTIAGSAVVFCFKAVQESQSRRHERMFKLFELLDGPGPLAMKLGAAYQLRFFPEHDEFITRFCKAIATNTQGSSAQSLVDELIETMEYIERGRPKVSHWNKLVKRA